MAEQNAPSLTAYQIDQLLKLLPPASSNTTSSISHTKNTDEEIDYNFTGTVVCLLAEPDSVNWVIDIGATNHMTSLSNCLSRVKNGGINCSIKLPNGNQGLVTLVGDVQLSNNLTLKDTLAIPDFKYNLLSVSKLCRDSKCVVVFYDEICLLQDYATRMVKGLGEYKDGLYHLVNSPLQQISPKLLNKGTELLTQLYSRQRERNSFVVFANK